VTGAALFDTANSAPLRSVLCVEDNPAKLSSFTQLIGCANTQTKARERRKVIALSNRACSAAGNSALPSQDIP